MRKIVIVGAGFMGSAVARALRRSDSEVNLAVVEKDPARRDGAIRELGAYDYTSTPGQIWAWADLVVLAVKPQDKEITAEQIRPEANEDTARKVPVVSLLAGTSISSIQDLFKTERVTRMMPNLAADIGKAVVGVTFAPAIPETVRSDIRKLFAGLGTLITIDEKSMAAVTAVSGSGIAFVFEFIHAMALGAVAQGLPYPQALTAARDVVESAAVLLRENAVHPEEMVSRVCSPAGTTIAGMRALADGRLQATVMNALAEAAERSRELEL